MEAYKIKKLEWAYDEYLPCWYTVNCIFEQYKCFWCEGNVWITSHESGMRNSPDYVNVDDAKVSCQAHYESQVKKALEVVKL